MLSSKERDTIVFALEEYQQVLEKEDSIEARNYVMELIWKINAKGERK